MTKKLYDIDAYNTKFTSKVINVVEDKNGYAVELSETLFFPNEGGQSCDKGTLNGITVTNVNIKDDVILHYVSEPIALGTTVEGIIDWDHRFRNMQMHSGEHIFTGLVHNKFGYNNVGFHLSDNSATMDYDGKLSEEEIYNLELEANKVIWANKSIKAYYPTPEELKTIDYRSKKELAGDVRIVIVEDTDICACCAPHVHLTGEIGIFKVVNFENYKGGVRVHYLCGLRAFEHYDERIKSLKSISNALTVKEGFEASKTLELLENSKAKDFEIVRLNNLLIEREIKQTAISNPSENGIYITGKEGASYLRYSMEVLHKFYPGICASFAGDDENGYRYIIESDSCDMTKLQSKLKEQYGAKGGGKSNSIQGNMMITQLLIKTLFN